MAKTEWGLNDILKPADLNELGEDINQLRERLDSADTANVNLQPGLQVINVAKDARFRLNKIVGKTEINGQGRTGLIGVESPYVINTSGNLLPPIYEWEQGITVEDTLQNDLPYVVTINAITGGSFVRYYVGAMPGKTYTLSVEAIGVNALAYMYLCRSDKSRVSPDKWFGSVTANSDTEFVEVVLNTKDASGNNAPGLAEFLNPMLTVGPESQPFVSQRKSMLAFQTELHANPTDGGDRDVLFEQDGEYRKLAKWKKVILDGALDWFMDQPRPGYKNVYVRFSSQADFSEFVTKYDGTILTHTVNATELFSKSDNSLLNGVGINITVSNTDSGWGDGYTPTPGEIKAYFMGWRMAHLDGTTPYTDTGVSAHGAKVWIPVLGFTGSNGTNTLPTSVSTAAVAAGWAPYNLLYRLAKETVEPVVTEGSLLLSEGDNMVEVGTGIVLRESVSPRLSTTVARINNTDDTAAQPNSRLNFQVEKILQVYKNNTPDNWSIISVGPAYGNERANKELFNFDPSAAYSVTYIKLDKSPIQPISGSLAANEKAQISDLTAGVTEALQRVSVVEQKKAEKDAPGWITPTLLNGWINYDSVSYLGASFNRDSTGRVRFAGLIAGGSINPGVLVFRVPAGYRPKKQAMFDVPCSDGNTMYLGALVVGPDGSITLLRVPANGFLSLEGITFLAEQ